MKIEVKATRMYVLLFVTVFLISFGLMNVFAQSVSPGHLEEDIEGFPNCPNGWYLTHNINDNPVWGCREASPGIDVEHIYCYAFQGSSSGYNNPSYISTVVSNAGGISGQVVNCPEGYELVSAGIYYSAGQFTDWNNPQNKHFYVDADYDADTIECKVGTYLSHVIGGVGLCMKGVTFEAVNTPDFDYPPVNVIYDGCDWNGIKCYCWDSDTDIIGGGIADIYSRLIIGMECIEDSGGLGYIESVQVIDHSVSWNSGPGSCPLESNPPGECDEYFISGHYDG
jgi:hypothetical protein